MTYVVHGVAASGNCYNVRTHTPEFLRMNPNGKVPILQIEPKKRPVVIGRSA